MKDNRFYRKKDVYTKSEVVPKTKAIETFSGNITIYVGQYEKFTTLNAAFQYLDGLAPEYKKSGVKATIIIKTGTVIAEQLLFVNQDFGWVEIQSESGDISVDPAALTTAFLDFFSGTFPFIAGWQSILPTINCIFSFTGTPSGSTKPGILIASNSSCDMLVNAGVKNAYGVGIWAWGNSQLKTNALTVSGCASLSISIQRGSIWTASGNIAVTHPATATSRAVYVSDNSNFNGSGTLTITNNSAQTSLEVSLLSNSSINAVAITGGAAGVIVGDNSNLRIGNLTCSGHSGRIISLSYSSTATIYLGGNITAGSGQYAIQNDAGILNLYSTGGTRTVAGNGSDAILSFSHAKTWIYGVNISTGTNYIGLIAFQSSVAYRDSAVTVNGTGTSYAVYNGGILSTLGITGTETCNIPVNTPTSNGLWSDSQSPSHSMPARSSTIVVAASNSTAKSKLFADYVCDGIADDVEILAAMAAISNSGTVMLTEGQFNITNRMTVSATVHLKGQGKATSLYATGIAAGGSVLYIANPDNQLTISDIEIHCNNLDIHGIDTADIAGRAHYSVHNVTVKYASAANRAGFNYVKNLTNCKAQDCLRGFRGCRELSDCVSLFCTVGFLTCYTISSSKAYQCGTGFSSCSDVSACYADDCSGTGYDACSHVSACTASSCVNGFADCSGVSSSYSVSNSGNGFLTSHGLSDCTASQNAGDGFESCWRMTTCYSVFNSDVGFRLCKQMTLNYAASNTNGNYNTCYASHGTGSAIAANGTDTAAGGFNVGA